MKRLMLLAILIVTVSVLTAGTFTGKKVLYIDSYHSGYAWSDGIEAGVKKIIEPSGATLKVIHLDTKRNNNEDFYKKAAQDAKKTIETFQPDIVIASDDYTAKYIIQPFYKDAKLPFVFCGVNWDASVYGFPYSNVTGMEEVALIKPLLDKMKPHAKGDRIGYIEFDDITAHKDVENINKHFGLKMKVVYVKTFNEWKTKFTELQGQVDMLIVGNNAGIAGFNDKEAAAFVEKNTKIPTGSVLEHMADFVLVTYSKVAEEQGRWAATSALKILGGASPKSIPITKNKEGILYVNMKIAKTLNVSFPLDVLKVAKKIQ